MLDKLAKLLGSVVKIGVWAINKRKAFTQWLGKRIRRNRENKVDKSVSTDSGDDDIAIVRAIRKKRKRRRDES